MTASQPQTSHSTPRLTEIARHVVCPPIATTGWPAIEETSREFGVEYDPWQKQVGRRIFGKREDGLYAAGIGGVVLSWPRQTGKTFTIGNSLFSLCKLFPELTVIWTAHQLRTSNETFRAMQGYARGKKIARHIAKVTRGAGDEGIHFVNGSRILFGARERGFGLGFAKVDILVIDEAQRITDRAMDDMVPATNQAPNPLVFLIGTPPRPTDPGEAFANRRREALSGESEDMLYIEFSADEDCDGKSIDWNQVAKANPSFPSRTPRAAIKRMHKMLGAASFRREGLGIWDTNALDQPYPLHLWNRGVVEAPPVNGSVAYGVKFSTDGQRVALAGAMHSDGSVFVEVISVTASDSIDGLASWLVERWRKADCIVVDGKSGAGDLVARLRQAGIPSRRIITPSVDEVITAHAGLATSMTEGTVTHSGQPGLDASVAVAARRKIGNRGGWGVEPIEADGDVLPLEAVVFARFGVVTTRVKHGQKAGGRRAVVM
jgi:phage terminase large subunit-like protein